MKVDFHIKLEERIGLIYIKPIIEIKGQFNPDTELKEFISKISNDIENKIIEYKNTKKEE